MQRLTVLISTFEQLKPYIKQFAVLRAEYYLWNVQARYKYKPLVFEKNAERRGLSLDKILNTYRGMKETGKFTEEQLQEMMHDFLTGQWILLLFIDNDLVGCVRLKRYNNSVAKLHSLYVSPSHRGNRYGSQLLDKIIQTAREHKFQDVYLETVPFMQPALDLCYLKGFQQVDYFDFGYPTPEAAEEIGVIFMKLELDNMS